MASVPDDPEQLAAAVGQANDRVLAQHGADAADLDAHDPAATPLGTEGRAAFDALRAALRRAREHLDDPRPPE